ncbi:MAG: hypothetical protein Kow00105_05510 [Phycisphaeraceae bacterium]
MHPKQTEVGKQMIHDEPRSDCTARTHETGILRVALLDCFPQPAVLLDNHGVVQAANQQMAELLCADVSGLAGRAWSSLVFRAQDGQTNGWPSHKHTNDTIRVLLRDGQAPRFVLESRRAGGAGSPWSGMSLLTLTDISALKESEQAWRDLCTQVSQLSDAAIEEALRLRRGLDAARPTQSGSIQTHDSGGAVRSWLRLALSLSVIRRGLAYAVVVGTILILINHGDAILRGDLNLSRAMQMGLTLLVPYAVSTLSSVGAMRSSGTQ